MNTGPDSHDEDDEVPDASELLDFELIAKSEPEKGRGLWLWVVLVLVLAGGAGAGWMYLQGDSAEVAAGDGGVPLILAPKFKLKEPPVDPGGMKVPDRDKLVYDRMAGEGGEQPGGVERLLPPPETPIEPPQALDAAPAPKAVQEAAPQVPPPAPSAPSAPKAVAPQPAPQPMPAPAAPQEAPKIEPQAPPPAPAPSASFKATAPAGQGYLVQLSAVRTEQAAKSEWARLLKANPDVLGGLESVIVRADLGDKGIFYRVRAGWFTSRAEAKAICDELATRNVGCLIAKP